MKNLFSKIFKMTHLMNKEYNYDKLKKKNCKKYRRRILEKGMSENVSTFLMTVGKYWIVGLLLC